MTADPSNDPAAEAFAPALAGNLAVVTGAGRGIGASCARALAAAGADVRVLARTRDEVDRVTREIRETGGRAQAVALDVCDGNAVDQFFADLPSLDVLVNNAGTNRPQPFLAVDDATFDMLFDVNVRAAFRVARAAARRMQASGSGSIVNMSSQMGHVGAPDRTVYCATKHAIEGLTKAMAVELGPAGIRVNAVAPTFVRTPMTEPFLADPAFQRDVLGKLATGRLAEPHEVAAAVVYLASPLAASTTGTSLSVDGGWTAH